MGTRFYHIVKQNTKMSQGNFIVGNGIVTKRIGNWTILPNCFGQYSDSFHRDRYKHSSLHKQHYSIQV